MTYLFANKASISRALKDNNMLSDLDIEVNLIEYFLKGNKIIILDKE